MRKRRRRKFVQYFVEDEPDVAGFTGVIKPSSEIRPGAAGTKDHEVSSPPSSGRLIEKSLRVVGAHSALESVKQQHPGSAPLRSQAMDLEKITVGRIPTLHDRRRRWLSPEKLAPQVLQMATRNP